MGLFFPVLFGAFVFWIIIIMVFAFVVTIAGFLGGGIACAFKRKFDAQTMVDWWIVITFLLAMYGAYKFISMF